MQLIMLSSIAQLSTQKLDVKAKLASKMSKTVCYLANLKNQGMHNFHKCREMLETSWSRLTVKTLEGVKFGLRLGNLHKPSKFSRRWTSSPLGPAMTERGKFTSTAQLMRTNLVATSTPTKPAQSNRGQESCDCQIKIKSLQNALPKIHVLEFLLKKCPNHVYVTRHVNGVNGVKNVTRDETMDNHV